tara:strand:+ start:69 stop:350 length:282 start_codon:yes stop_codon:yes gene_type:complete
MKDVVNVTKTRTESETIEYSLEDVVDMVIKKMSNELSHHYIYDSEPYLDTSDNGETIEVSMVRDGLMELDGDFQAELKKSVIKAITTMTLEVK